MRPEISRGESPSGKAYRSVTSSIRCMQGTLAGSVAAGGVAAVHCLPDVPAELVIEAAESMLPSLEAAHHTNVFVAGGAGQYVAESYSIDGVRIRFCGHGALAAAWLVLREYEPNATRLEFANADRRWRAQRASGTAADISLTYARPAPAVCPVPAFAAEYIGVEPVAAAKVGASTDYLILELADVDAVRELQPRHEMLSRATSRAVIVTARAAFDAETGFVFRYFAPQYGNPEDAATGSAAVQLAAFWSLRLNHDRFTALQLSAGRALMYLDCTGDKVELAARVGYG